MRIDQNEAMIEVVYLKLTTKSGSYHVHNLTITVCGLEKASLDDTELVYYYNE